VNCPSSQLNIRKRKRDRKRKVPKLGFVLVLCACTSLKSKVDTKHSSASASVPQPAGQLADNAVGYGLYMLCSVINASDPKTVSSEIGCTIFNNDGSGFVGTTAGLAANVAVVGQAATFAGQPAPTPAASGYSIIVTAAVPPASAKLIQISGTFAGQQYTLQAPLTASALKCASPLEIRDFYVSTSASASQVLCTKDAPCGHIGQAVTLIPDIITCQISIHIASGTYTEKIDITDRSFANTGSLTFSGETQSYTVDANTYATIRPSSTLIQTPNPIKVGQFLPNAAVAVAALNPAGGAAVYFKNLIIDGGVATGQAGTLNTATLLPSTIAPVFDTGFSVQSSAVILSNVQLRNLNGTAITATNGSSLVITDGLSISNVSDGLEAFQDYALELGGKITIDSSFASVAPCTLASGATPCISHGLWTDHTPVHLRTNASLSISSFGYGMLLEDATAVTADDPITLSLSSNVYGMQLNGSTWATTKDSSANLHP